MTGAGLEAEVICALSVRVPVQTSWVYTISILLRLLAVWEGRLFGRSRKATNDKPSDKHKLLTSEGWCNSTAAGEIFVHKEGRPQRLSPAPHMPCKRQRSETGRQQRSETEA